MASGAGESHPRALSEPDVHVSAHPAPISRIRDGIAATRFLFLHRIPPGIPVDAMQQREKHDPFAPRALLRFHTTTGRSAPVPGVGTLALVGHPLGHLPLHPDDRFPGSLREPEPSSRHLYAGRHVGSTQVSPTLIPSHKSEPGFDVI